MKKISLLLVVILLSFTSSAQTKKDTIGKYNWGSENYPGIEKGEVFLMLISTTTYYDGQLFWAYSDDDNEFSPNYALMKNYGNISWKTKRMGYTAYTPDGIILSHHRPVFVKKIELLKAGMLK